MEYKALLSKTQVAKPAWYPIFLHEGMRFPLVFIINEKESIGG
jgi:hypothetical protein